MTWDTIFPDMRPSKTKESANMTQAQREALNAQRREFLVNYLDQTGIPQKYNMEPGDAYKMLQECSEAVHVLMNPRPSTSH